MVLFNAASATYCNRLRIVFDVTQVADILRQLYSSVSVEMYQKGVSEPRNFLGFSTKK
jgi:hypothetical protein